MSPPSWERRTRRRGKQHERLPVPNEKEGRTLGRPPSLNGPVGLETDRSYERPHRPVSPSCLRRSCGRSSSKPRSEEHTSELQSRSDLVCRLLLEKKKKTNEAPTNSAH